MAHDPSLGYADYFAAPGSGDGAGATLVPEVDEHEMYGLGLHHQSGVEMFGARGFMSPASAQSKAALVDVNVDGSSTISFFPGEQQHQHRQMSQAPLSLSLHGPPEAAASSFMPQHLQLGGGGEHRQAWQLQQQTAPAAWQLQGAGSWHMRGSRFLLPTQQLLQEFCSIPVESTTNDPAATANKTPKHHAQEEHGGGSSSSASWPPSAQIQTMDAAELQRLKAKLYTMLEEVDRRYRRYREQMRAVAGSFEAVAGERAAALYTKMASRTISSHFRSLRDRVAAQVQAVRRALGEKVDATTAAPGMTKGETPRLRALDQCLRQHKAYQSGMLESHPWRPQRGLPERAVSVLRAWLFEHFLHPYPSDMDKHILARQTGLSRSQVSNWFINARVRLWKPMVEEMYVEEMKDKEGSGGGQSTAQASDLQNPNLGGSYASEGIGEDGGGGGEEKPTRAQLHPHDAGSLASIVSIGRMDQHQENLNFGMDHLDFDAYEAAGAGGGQHGFGGRGVSLTLGLQQQQQHADGSRHGGVNVAFAAASPSPSSAVQGGAAGHFMFMAGEQQMGGGGGVHPAHGGQFGADAASSHYHRGLGATGFHLLHDLAG